MVNDAYNANPDSTGPPSRPWPHLTGNGRRGFAVLGYMAELGDIAAQSHEEAGRLAARAGRGGHRRRRRRRRPVLDGARAEAGWPARRSPRRTRRPPCAALRNRLRPGDVVLVKASKAAGLWEVADGLLAEDDQ